MSNSNNTSNTVPDSMSNALGINPITTYDTVNDLIVTTFDDSAKQDFTEARTSISDTLDLAKNAMHELAQISNMSQQPKAYEALAKMMDVVIKGGEALLKTHEMLQKIDKPDDSKNNPKSVVNNLFVGSTAELQKVIEEMKNKGSV